MYLGKPHTIERDGDGATGYSNMIFIVNPQTHEILDYITLDNVIDDNHKLNLETYLQTYDAIVLGGGRYDKYLEKRNRVIIPDEDGTLQEFVLFEVDKYRDTEGRKTHFYAHASYLELKKANIIYPNKYESLTASQLGGIALNNTGWQIGIVEATGTRTMTIENHTSPYEFIKRIAREFEVELRFRVETDGQRITGRYVDMLERIGEWRGRQVEFGRDLDGIRRIEKQDIVTALLGLGPEKEDGTRMEVLGEDEDALQRWGRVDEHGNLHHLIEPYEIQSDRQEMTEEEARQYTRTALDKRINTQVGYETTVVDLEEVPGMSNKKIRFGDTIRIKDTHFNPPLYLEARVYEMTRSLKFKAKKDIKLGDYIEYTEEQVNAVWNQLRNEIRKRLDRIAVVSINSSAGNVFKNAQGSTELTARTFVSGSERDENGTLYDYQWIKFDKDGNLVNGWVEQGKTITVTANDIDEKATYRVLVAYELDVIGTNEITISNVFDGQQGEQGPPGEKGAPGPNRVDENTEFGDGYDPTKIEIGGRNYARELGGDNYNINRVYSIDRQYTTIATIDGKLWLKQSGNDIFRIASIPIERNTTYTWSFNIYKTGSEQQISVHQWDGSRYGDKNYIVGNLPVRIKHTFTSRSNSTREILHLRELGTSDEWYFSDFKLEKGNKATDWSPAPEDVEQAIQEVYTTADGKNTIIPSATEPSTTGRKVGDAWFELRSDGSMVIHDFNGVEWVKRQFGEQSLIANSITAAHIKSLAGLNVNDQFVVDADGNVSFAGHLEGATGTFSGKLSTQQDIDVGRRITVLWSVGEESGIFFKGPTEPNPRSWIRRTDGGDLEIFNDEGKIRLDSLNILYSLTVETGASFHFLDTPLWTGQMRMTDTQTVTPSKWLYNCMTDWILRWQRHISGQGAADSHYGYTHISKNHSNGASVAIPLAFSANEPYVRKLLYIYDDGIVGHADNLSYGAENITLTGVFEY